MSQLTPNLTSEPPLAILSMPQVFVKVLQLASSVLMDTCHLSATAIKNALPAIAKLLSYQFIHISQNIKKQNSAHGQQATSLNDMLQSTVVQALYRYQWENGFNFQQLTQLTPHLEPIKTAVFADNQQYQRVLGVLMVHTQLPIQPLNQLLSWCTLLAIKALADIKNQFKNQQKVTDSTANGYFETWLTWQPIFLAQSTVPLVVPFSQDMAWVTNYHDPMSGQSRQRQLADLYRYPTPLHNQLATILQHYVDGQPFAIAPIINKGINKKAIALFVTTAPLLSSKTPKPQPDIFAKNTTKSLPYLPTKNRLTDTLQKYWIATAVVVSGVVFGTIGLLTHGSKPSPFEPVQPASVASTPKYNDVAIMRVASEPEPTPKPDAKTETIASVANSQSNKSNKTDKKTTEKADKKATGKTADKATDKKQLDKSNKKTADKNSSIKKPSDKNPTDKKLADKKPIDKKATEKNTSAQKSPNKKVSDKRPTDKTIDKNR